MAGERQMVLLHHTMHSVSLRWHHPVQVLRVLSQAAVSHPQRIREKYIYRHMQKQCAILRITQHDLPLTFCLQRAFLYEKDIYIARSTGEDLAQEIPTPKPCVEGPDIFATQERDLPNRTRLRLSPIPHASGRQVKFSASRAVRRC